MTQGHLAVGSLPLPFYFSNKSWLSFASFLVFPHALVSFFSCFISSLRKERGVIYPQAAMMRSFPSVIKNFPSVIKKAFELPYLMGLSEEQMR